MKTFSDSFWNTARHPESRVNEVFPTPRGEADMNPLYSRIEIRDEAGVILARQQTRTIAEQLGFPARDRHAIASAVTHAACEAVRHTGGGLLEFGLDGETTPALAIRVVDRPSPDLDRDLKPGVPRDFEPSRQWMDRFDVEAVGGRTTVSIARRIPDRNLPIDPSLTARIIEALHEFQPISPIAELLDQDLTLFRSFDQIEDLEAEQSRLETELEESRTGILSLDAELSERAECLRDAHELKTRFLSRVSHELRTPLASILGLARLLLDRADGELEAEQERQVSFIIRAAHDLSALINDLIDLARLEAGREKLHLSEVHVSELFAALRGMFRPLIPPGSAVQMIIEEPAEIAPLWTDEAKLTQILRNFLSNALKFTDRGEIRVEAAPGIDHSVVFSISDTGLGIASEDHERVFEEFGKVETLEHHQMVGTGLGLPLARKLARLLGGRVDVRSSAGLGSTFTATIPSRYTGKRESFEDDLFVS